MEEAGRDFVRWVWSNIQYHQSSSNFVASYLAWAHKVGDPIARNLVGGCGSTVNCGTVAIGSLSSASMSILATVEDADLANLVDQSYRPNAIIGDGGTADAIRYERETGNLLSKRGHSIKGREMITALRGILAKDTLSASDRRIATELMHDYMNALH